MRAVPLGRHDDLRAAVIVAIAQSVLHEVGQHTHDGVGIGHHFRIGQLAPFEPCLRIAQHAGHCGDSFAHQRGCAQGRPSRKLLTRLRTCQHQQIFHNAVHARGVLQNGLQELVLQRICVVFLLAVVQQRFHVAGDGRQRRAQLMRHVGHEVALRALELLQARGLMQHCDCTTSRQRRRACAEDTTGHKGVGACLRRTPLRKRRLH